MDEFQATYLSRRLAETRRVESLAASIRFDLARSGLDDDQLEAAVNAFAQTEPSTGWGWSTVLNDLVTREPKRVPVTDMKAFQQNLINLGYASPLTVASGTWDPSWYGAARRYDRDLQEGQMAGKNMLAAPLRQGIELLGQTMPSSIWKNVVGWAKGFVEQTPETVGRVGALGGAVSGAAIGALVGGPVGAVAGGAIGAGIGFFGDLLQDDEEGEQSVLASIADALTPFEEYAGNSKAFFEDLGYVGTIASVIGGVKVASGLLEGSVKGITSTLANQGAADVQLGLPGTIIRGMTRRIAPGSLEAVSQGLARVSPIAHLAKYPAAGMVNGIYTGFSTASVGIHLTAGLGQGSRDVNEDLRVQAAALMRASVTEGRNLTQEEMELIDRANHGVGVGTIEQAISETEVPGELGSLNAGPQVFGMPLSDWLLPANMLDIASFFFWPQKILPIVPGGISKTLGKLEDVPLTPGIAASYAKLDGSEHRLRPWVYALMGDGISSSEARAWAKEHINPAYDAYVRMDSGVKTLTYRQLRENVIEMSKADITFGQTYRANIAKMYAEGATGRSPTAQRAFAETVVNDNSFLAHLSETLPPGKDLRTAVIQHQEAIAEVSRLEGSMRAAGFKVEVIDGKTVQVAHLPEGDVTIPFGRMTIQHDAAELQDLTVRLEAQIAQAEAAKLADGATLKDLPEMTAKIEKLKADLADTRKLLDQGGKENVARGWEKYRLMMNRLDTPTRREWYGMNRQYKTLRQKLDALTKQAKKAEAGIETPGFGSPQYMALHTELTELVDGWLAKGLISESVRDSALAIKTNKRMGNFLTSRAKAAAIDADVPQATRDYLFERGYKPVLTGENVISPTEAEKWIEISGVGDFTRRRAFFEMIGLREKPDLDQSLWKLRQATEMSELQQTAEKVGIERTARDIYMKIYTHMEELNHPGTPGKNAAVWGPFLFTGTGPKLFKIDIRQMRPQDLIDALEGWLPKGKEWEAGMELYGALRRGVAFGGDWKGLRSMTTMRSLGRSLGISGLPGFSDLIRTWHTKDPLAITKKELPLAPKALSDDLVITPIGGGGNVAITGWHSPMPGRGLPEAGAELGFGGFHFGTKTAAEERASQTGVLGAKFEVVGKDDLVSGHYPTREAAEADIAKSRAATGERYGPYSIREASHEILPIQAEGKFFGADDPLTEIDNNVLAAGSFEEAVIANHVMPREMEGKWLDELPGPEDIDGLSPQMKQLIEDVGVEGDLRAELQRRGYAGVAYENGVEDIGSTSVMVFDMNAVQIPKDQWTPQAQWRLTDLKAKMGGRAKRTLQGAVLGAAVGATAGDQPSDILAGAGIGAAAGFGFRTLEKRTFGYLPDSLVRINTALRYTLSLTFDAGRYSEQNMIAMAKYGLPPMYSPKRYIKGHAGMKSPYRDSLVSGEEAWADTVRFWDEINGTSWFQSLDDTDRRMYQAGLLGFQPRNWEAAQAMQLYQRGLPHAKIEEAIKTIGRYGLGRSAAEKSANFIFFPFSFSKKLLSTLGDFAIQAPGRNLLVYEGFRRYYESTLDEDFHTLIEDHLPLLEQLAKVNNLTYGVSPGRFFLKGLGDQRTNAGKAAFLLSQFFVPSGAATPLAQSAGAAADLAVNAFVPIIFTGESIDRLGGIEGVNDVISRYIPLSREIQQYWTAVNEQKTAITQGATPWAQVQDYLDQRREFSDGLRPMAAMMGYVDPEAFLASNAGAPYKAQWEQLNIELSQKYPSAQDTLGNFEQRTSQSAVVLYELAQKEERGAGEDAILGLAKTIEVYDRMKDLGFLSSSIADRVQSTAVREFALKYIDDRRFRELYVLLFRREFGPLEVAS